MNKQIDLGTETESTSEARTKFFFCFTLDTEPDNLWEPFSGLRFDHFARLLDFHRALQERGAKPVYLTTSEVADCPQSARVLDKILATGQAELGAHFHTWTRDWPFDVPPLGNPPIQAMAHQLGQPLEEKMLQFTCDALEKTFRVRPRSYRGGRWSFSHETARSLRNSGIAVDSTVTPGRTWQDPRHPLLDGPDFRQFPRHPYFLHVGSDEMTTDSGDILELPVGSSFIRAGWLGRQGSIVGRSARKLHSLLGRPQGWLWLRPTSMSRSETLACLESMRRDEIPVWVSMIHSSEIIPCRKFSTEAAVDRFVKRCLQLVEDAVELGATCATLGEVGLRYGQPV
jgi:hypothetical protein